MIKSSPSLEKTSNQNILCDYLFKLSVRSVYLVEELFPAICSFVLDASLNIHKIISNARIFGNDIANECFIYSTPQQ